MKKTLALLPVLFVLTSCGPDVLLGAAIVYDIKECQDRGGTWDLGECTLPDEDGYSGIDIIDQTPVTEDETTGASAE